MQKQGLNPNGRFRGRQAMTRQEAAALVNAFLDRITAVTDELKRLIDGFEKDIVLLEGEATVVIRTNTFGGNQCWPKSAPGMPAAAADAFAATAPSVTSPATGCLWLGR